MPEMKDRTEERRGGRPPLRKLGPEDVLLFEHRVLVVVTMLDGTWDEGLARSYASGCILLEVSASGRPLAAYQQADASVEIPS